MKTHSLVKLSATAWVILGHFLVLSATAQTPLQPPMVVSADAHSRVIQQVWQAVDDGTLSTNTYVELATGLNRWDPTAGVWVPAVAEFEQMPDGEGIGIHAVAANNDFSCPAPEVREAQICYLRELIRMTADLGAKHLRVFLAWWGVTKHPQLATYDIMEHLWPIVHEKFSSEEIWGWCRDALIECAGYAGEFGVTLALQNHRPVIKDYHDVLRMVKEVNSPWLKVCLDAPLMLDKSVQAMREAANAVGPLQVLSHFGGEFERLPDGSIRGYERIDGIAGGETRQYYQDFARAMREIGYQGYISYELCHQLPVVNGQTVGIEYADMNAELAARFMREIINAAS